MANKKIRIRIKCLGCGKIHEKERRKFDPYIFICKCGTKLYFQGELQEKAQILPPRKEAAYNIFKIVSDVPKD